MKKRPPVISKFKMENRCPWWLPHYPSVLPQRLNYLNFIHFCFILFSDNISHTLNNLSYTHYTNIHIQISWLILLVPFIYFII